MNQRIRLTNNLRNFFCAVLLASLCPILGMAQMPTTSVNLRNYSWQCKVSALKKMGWSILPTSEGNSVTAPELCETKSIQQLGLQLKINLNDTNERNIHNTIEEAFLSPGTNCAYQSQLNAASIKATRKLKSNHLYIFTPFWTKDDMRLGTLKKEWQRVTCAGRCFIPTQGETANAIQALYGSIFSSDCGVGLELAEMATVKELFGSEKFSSQFSREEVMVGDIQALPESKSFMRGKNASTILPPNGLNYAGAGPEYFVGVSGYVGSVFDESYLDDKANQNENFMVVSVSAKAAKTFLENGGLTYYDDYIKKVWETTKGISKDELQTLEFVAYQNRLAKATDITLQNNMAPDTGIVSDRTVEVLNLLKDPFLSETQIYVHPFGPRSISWHIARLARLNPRTPYNVRFYPDAMHAGVYDRWVKSLLDDCLAYEK